MRRAIFILIALSAGCCQKGPLTLPEKHPGDVVTRPTHMPADTPPADETQKKKDESDKTP